MSFLFGIIGGLIIGYIIGFVKCFFNLKSKDLQEALKFMGAPE